MLRQMSMWAAIGLLLTVTVTLTACAAPPASSAPSLYHCDRNGEREQRVEC